MHDAVFFLKILNYVVSIAHDADVRKTTASCAIDTTLFNI